MENSAQPTEPTRINGKYIIGEISSVLSFKKGILFTIRELLIRPGISIRAFIHEDRQRLVKPVIFLIFCSFIYAILQQLLHFEERFVNYRGDGQESTTMAIMEWVQGNYGYANIFMAFFVAFWAKVFFRKKGYNFFEILVLVFYIFGIIMLISSLFGVIEALTGLGIIFAGGLLTFIYASWAIGQFFEGRKISNYLRGLLSYIFGLLFSSIIVLLIGTLIDLVI